MASFESVWKYLQSHLRRGTTVKNWSPARGYSGRDMRVSSANDEAVTAAVEGAKTFMVIKREDFAKVWKVWGGYKAGRVTREEARQHSRFAGHILSIFHWYEVKSGKAED